MSNEKERDLYYNIRKYINKKIMTLNSTIDEMTLNIINYDSLVDVLIRELKSYQSTSVSNTKFKIGDIVFKKSDLGENVNKTLKEASLILLYWEVHAIRLTNDDIRYELKNTGGGSGSVYVDEKDLMTEDEHRNEIKKIILDKKESLKEMYEQYENVLEMLD